MAVNTVLYHPGANEMLHYWTEDIEGNGSTIGTVLFDRICLSLCLSVCLFVCLSVCLSVCPSIYLLYTTMDVARRVTDIFCISLIRMFVRFLILVGQTDL